MKIVHISIFPDRGQKHAKAGGVSSYTKNLVSSIPFSREDEVYVICNKLNDIEETYLDDGVEVIRCFNKDYRFLFQILKAVRRVNPDVVHLQQELALYGNPITSYLFQWLVFSLRRFKTITTLHGVVSINQIDKKFVKENNSNLPVFLVKIAFLIFYSPICFFSKKIIVHEKIFKDILCKEYYIKEDKIEVIPHGIEDLKSLDLKKSRDYLNLPSNKKIVLFMGYLAGYKGIDLLIEGFKEFIKYEPNSLLIIGAGIHPKHKNNENYMNVYNSFKSKASDLLGENHIWVGFIEEEEIVYYYSASDLSIYPYTNHLASSGPMSISIGYDKPFLASEVFHNSIEYKNMLFKKTPEDLARSLIYFYQDRDVFSNQIQKLKKNSLWSLNGEKIYRFYN